MRESVPPQLSPKQWAILARLAQGESTAAIGAALGIKSATVAEHLTRIYRQVPRDPALTKRAAVSTWYLREGRVLREEEPS